MNTTIRGTTPGNTNPVSTSPKNTAGRCPGTLQTKPGQTKPGQTKPSRTRPARVLGITAVCLLLCTGCFSGDSAGTTTPDSPAPEPSSTYTPTHSAGDNPHAPDTMAVPANPAWLSGDREEATDTAVKALQDFARPGLEPVRWANDFARWLTPEAVTAYSFVDPATIPVTTVTGPASLDIDDTNGFGATAEVPTNIGTYRVQLLRQGQDQPWKVNRLYPPETAG